MKSKEFFESVDRVTQRDTLLMIESAWYKVFCGSHNEKSMIDILDEEIKSSFGGQVTKETSNGTKYKVRVKDRNTGSSYIRFATREKIAELRANPNISSVELTNHTAGAANQDGTDASRQNFSGSPNSNNSTYQGKLAQRYQKERQKQKKDFGMGAGV